MNCTDIINSLDDILDGDLPAGKLTAVESHVAGCLSCRERLARERALLGRLRRLPAPEPDPALFDRALAKAIEQDGVRRRWRWLGTGGALAASLVLVIGLSVQFQAQTHAPALPGISIALDEEREISLVVESQQGLDSATFTIVLPQGIEITGYPGQTEITWVGRLEPGQNLLVIPVRAQAGAGGDIVTQIRHTDKQKTFTVRMDINPGAPDLIHSPASPEPTAVM
jgi:hypothetical protein